MCSKSYPPYFNKFFIPKLIIEAVAFVFALHAGIKDMRKIGGIEISNSLLHILVKDSIFRFIM